MKELDNLIEMGNIQELDITEAKNTSGGIWLLLAVLFVAGVIWGAVDNPNIVDPK